MLDRRSIEVTAQQASSPVVVMKETAERVSGSRFCEAKAPWEARKTNGGGVGEIDTCGVLGLDLEQTMTWIPRKSSSYGARVEAKRWRKLDPSTSSSAVTDLYRNEEKGEAPVPANVLPHRDEEFEGTNALARDVRSMFCSCGAETGDAVKGDGEVKVQIITKSILGVVLQPVGRVVDTRSSRIAGAVRSMEPWVVGRAVVVGVCWWRIWCLPSRCVWPPSLLSKHSLVQARVH
ncbi:hypothetical protein B296_00020052 [Ensete ventricosum]|uniref:Uncharacterized protein n=1 Tax=Ensete ventricosum TaxID=4639 RepID=A0A426XXL0_ENSVE|nr:hypothetical protein B296_00020052 [Ensete ventricosum]